MFQRSLSTNVPLSAGSSPRHFDSKSCQHVYNTLHMYFWMRSPTFSLGWSQSLSQLFWRQCLWIAPALTAKVWPRGRCGHIYKRQRVFSVVTCPCPDAYKAKAANSEGDLRISMEVSPKVSDYSACSFLPVEFTDELGSSAQGKLYISFWAREVDELSISASEGGLMPSEADDSPGCQLPCLPELPQISGWNEILNPALSVCGWMIGFWAQFLSSGKCVRSSESHAKPACHGHPTGLSGRVT